MNIGIYDGRQGKAGRARGRWSQCKCLCKEAGGNEERREGGREGRREGGREGTYHAAFQVAHVERVGLLLVLVHVAVPVDLVGGREGGREGESMHLT